MPSAVKANYHCQQKSLSYPVVGLHIQNRRLYINFYGLNPCTITRCRIHNTSYHTFQSNLSKHFPKKRPTNYTLLHDPKSLTWLGKEVTYNDRKSQRSPDDDRQRKEIQANTYWLAYKVPSLLQSRETQIRLAETTTRRCGTNSVSYTHLVCVCVCVLHTFVFIKAPCRIFGE